MKRPSMLLLALLPCLLTAAPAQPRQAAETATVDGIPQAKILDGNLGRPGGLFSILVQAPAGFRVARHWHSSDTHLTVVEGNLTLEVWTGGRKRATTLGPGDHQVLLARVEHAASSAAGAVLQMHGAAPLEITYADPKDDPRWSTPAAAAGK